MFWYVQFLWIIELDQIELLFALFASGSASRSLQSSIKHQAGAITLRLRAQSRSKREIPNEQSEQPWVPGTATGNAAQAQHQHHIEGGLAFEQHAVSSCIDWVFS